MTKDINLGNRYATGLSERAATAPAAPAAPFLVRPSEVLNDPALNTEQKKDILASWLSDRNSVPDAPRWRRLENGAFADSQEILRALCALDDAEADRRRSLNQSAAPEAQSRYKFGRGPIGRFFGLKNDDDDDDPPPCPAALRPPVPNPAGPRLDSGLALALVA